MAKARPSHKSSEPRRLPRGRHALAPEEVLADQRGRLIAAIPGVVAEHGYEAMSVADIVKAAAVSRNAFYSNFSGKRDCFAAAHEACQERLLGVLERPCDRGASLGERVETTFVEAPSSAGDGVALRYHEWLWRYGALLRSATSERPSAAGDATELDRVIVGGIASRIATEVLDGGADTLASLTPHLVDYVLAFHGSLRPYSRASEPVVLDPEQQPREYGETRRKQAGA